ERERSFGGVDQPHAGRVEERHWKIAGEMNGCLVKTNIYWKRFDEVFAIITIVEGACAEEECDGRIHGCVWRIIPNYAQARTAELNGLLAGRGKFERPQHRRC